MHINNRKDHALDILNDIMKDSQALWIYTILYICETPEFASCKLCPFSVNHNH
jgi:hypothetical protein